MARIHGTEEDKVNCPFYFKMGACRHGDRCSRQHHKPAFSQTLLVPHFWTNPLAAVDAAGGDVVAADTEEVQDDFDDFYEEVFLELRKSGNVEEIHVVENLGDHMTGNLYVKYEDEMQAEVALRSLHGRWYAKRQLLCEFSPVTDFREARCRQFDETSCARGGHCNFLHVREPSRPLRKFLEKEYGFYIGKNREKSSSSRHRDRDRDSRDSHRDRDRNRDRDRDRPRDRDGDRHRDRDGDRDRDRDYRRGGGDRDGDGYRERERDRDGRRHGDSSRDRDRHHSGGGASREVSQRSELAEDLNALTT